MVAGRTHPDVAHREGERYRLTLEQAVADLGLEDHVEFDDRFLAIDEIADLLAATDVFVTPYSGREQIASGALTFGIAAGCARRLDAVLVRAGHARHRAPASSCRSATRSAAARRLPLHRGAGAACGGARRGAEDRRDCSTWPSVAEGDRVGAAGEPSSWRRAVAARSPASTRSS